MSKHFGNSLETLPGGSRSSRSMLHCYRRWTTRLRRSFCRFCTGSSFETTSMMWTSTIDARRRRRQRRRWRFATSWIAFVLSKGRQLKRINHCTATRASAAATRQGKRCIRADLVVLAKFLLDISTNWIRMLF